MATPLILTFYQSGFRNRCRWRLVHRNGNKIAQSSQGGGFSDLRDCEHNAAIALGGIDAQFIDDEYGHMHLPARPDIEVVGA